ncbi:imm11 family protein [Pleomorphomonas oryzae]|uniref:imm11 family protein n=1 Tax=Pleomorphomonas oryzae TaxID=261934 RepID=UPI0004787CC0|nr:DUF1629 domain-containing protein [Pleomorphomonas oryzae]
MPLYHHAYDYAPRYYFSFALLDREGRDVSKSFAFWLDQNMRKGMQAPIPAEVRPLVARQKNATKVKYDILFGTYVPLVSQGFKDLVEEFAPGENYFYNLEMFVKSGLKPEKTYYIMQLRTILDTIIVDKSSITVNVDKFGLKSYTPLGVGDYRTLREKDVRSSKIWVEKMFPEHIFMSDDFYKEFSRRGLSGFRHLYKADLE